MGTTVSTPQPTSSEGVVAAEVLSDDDTHYILCDAIRSISDTIDVRRAFSADHVLRSAIPLDQAKQSKNIPKGELGQLHSCRSPLSISDCSLMFGETVVSLSVLRQPVLCQFHSSQLGMSHTKTIHLCFAYWPFMDKDIGNSTSVFPMSTSNQISAKRGTCSTADINRLLVQNSC